MKFRAISTRTREQVGEEFEASDWGAAKIIGAMREDPTTRVVIQEVLPLGEECPSSCECRPVDDGSGTASASSDDEETPRAHNTLREIEKELSRWLSRPSGVLRLPEGYTLVAHIEQVGAVTPFGQRWEWPVSFTLVLQVPEKGGPNNGSSRGSLDNPAE